MKKPVSIALLLAASTLAVQPAFSQDVPMSGEEVRKAWAGKKVFGRSTTGGLLDFFLRADGTASVSVGNLADEGTWRATENGYCATWKKIRAGQERCFTVVRRGGTVLILNPDQSVGTEVLRVTD